jgi:RNA methyltransferase, TrmH family
VLSLWLAPGQSPPPHLASSKPPTFTAPPAVLARIAGVESGTGVGAVAEVALPGVPAWWREEGEAGGGASSETPLPRRLLALDGVQDPGNVGSLARAAAALGWDGLVLLPGCADPWGAKAVRAARGAAGWRLPTAVVACGERDTPVAAAALRRLADRAGLVVLAADADKSGGSGGATPSAPAVPASARGVCLVLGAEGPGLSPDARAAADAAVAVPMPGGLESLNVGQAGLLLMFALSESGPGEQGARGSVVGEVMDRLYGRGGWGWEK